MYLLGNTQPQNSCDKSLLIYVSFPKYQFNKKVLLIIILKIHLYYTVYYNVPKKKMFDIICKFHSNIQILHVLNNVMPRVLYAGFLH